MKLGVYFNKVCECGCGECVSKVGNKYIHNHHNIGRHHSEEAKRKMSESHIGLPNPFEGKYHTKETKRKISKANKGRIGYWLGKHRSEETKRKLSEAKKGKPSGRLGKNHTEESKRKVGIANKKHWQNPEYRERILKAQFAGRNIKPNRPEKRLGRLLNRLFPREYKYVGDGSVWIGFKNPDFINVNGQKKIIELFGSFWHSREHRLLAFGDTLSNKEHRKQRQKHFAKYGFRTLVIWQRELKNIPKLKRKLKVFHRVGHKDASRSLF